MNTTNQTPYQIAREWLLAKHPQRFSGSRNEVEDLLTAFVRDCWPKELQWSQTPPSQSGFYWHWNGDEDSAVLPLTVMYSGASGKCFVSIGQYGITEAVDCDQYGGWWAELKEPNAPTDESETYNCQDCGAPLVRKDRVFLADDQQPPKFCGGCYLKRRDATAPERTV